MTIVKRQMQSDDSLGVEVVRMVCPNANVTIKRLRWER